MMATTHMFYLTFVFFLSRPIIGSLQPPRISMQDLKSYLNNRDISNLESILEDGPGGKLGAFVVTDIMTEEYNPKTIQDFLEKAPKCIGSNDHLPQFELSDGSTRRTFATLKKDVYPMCMDKSLRHLSKGFTEVGELVSRLIELFSGKTLFYFENNIKVEGLNSFPSKDHVHVYHQPKPNKNSSSPFMVPYHIDNGIFLLITPFSGHGLKLKTSGRLEISTDDLEPTSILVLICRGLTDWLLADSSPEIKNKFFAVPHAVGSMNIPDQYRSVFARMKVAPMNAVNNPGGTPFSSIFTNNDNQNQNSQICSANDEENSGVEFKSTPKSVFRNSWLKMMDSQCKSGEAYCWMSCQELNLECPTIDRSICFSKDSNVTCNLGIDAMPMDPKCKWECRKDIFPDPDSTYIYPNNYCNGKMDMLMTGFGAQGVDKKNPCIILFIDAWTLDSRIKFIMACLGVMLIGFSVEGIIAFRRTVSKRSSYFSRLTHRTRKIIMVLSFGINLTLGYLAMLVAMTYSIELFICIILGLVIGHAIFNVNAGVGESIDPCCASNGNALKRASNYCRDNNGDTYPFNRALCEEAMPSILNRDNDSSVPCCSTGIQSERESIIDSIKS